MTPRRAARLPDLLALAALAVALPGLWIAPRMFFASWLCAWWFCTGATMGALASAWIHALTGGRWGAALRRAVLPLARRLPWLLLLFLPMAAGLARVFPWAGDSGAWTRDIDLPAFPRAWYAPGLFWLRLAAIGAAWWWIARPATFARKGRVAAALVIYAATGTLLAIDLVVSLVPGWYSTGHGLVNLGGGALGGAAFAVLAVACRAPRAFPSPSPRPARARVPPVWRDLGNLLLMWLLLWAYVAFLEFLIIWAENLPREVAWIVPRAAGGWALVGAALAALQFGACFVALLFRAVKDVPRRLAGVAAALLAGQLLNTAWLVLPSVDPHALAGWWLVPALAVAIGLPVAARAWREVDDAQDAPAPPPARAPEAVHA
jgi:hypothetical protein